MTRAVVLLSGGLDSATVQAIARRAGHRIYALSFQYGQRHEAELVSARALALDGADEHLILSVDLGGIGHSALTSATVDVPKDQDPARKGIPSTYVPARNSIFLAHALGYAETIGAHDIYIGVNAVDHSGYPDCRPEFIEAFQRVADVATAQAVAGEYRTVLHAPLISLSKALIIATGLELGVDYSLTSSCYDPRPSGACGRCDACRIRLAAWAELGKTDPIAYR